MGDYKEAINSIWHNIILNTIPLVFFSALLIGIIIYIIVQKIDLKNLVIFLCVLVVLCLSYVGIEYAVFFHETHNNIYVEYIGTFEYTYVLSHTGNQVNLIDEKNARIKCLDFDLDDGMYHGTIIYTKWSKWAVYIEGTKE